MKNAFQKKLLKRRQLSELPSLLTYAYCFNEKTVIHKDGAFSAHFKYIAQDVDSSTGAILDANARAVLQALSVLEDGWMVETNVISEAEKSYATTNAFPDVVSALIDDARRFHFEQDHAFFKSSYYLSLSYVPTDQLGKKLSKLMVENEIRTKTQDDEYAYFENTLQRFLIQFQKITANTAKLSPIQSEYLSDFDRNHLQRLESDALITFLHKCLTGLSHSLRVPMVGYFLDAFLASKDFLAGVIPKIGDQWIKVLSIDDLPEMTYPAILDELNYLGFEYRWSSRFIALSKLTAEKYLKSLKNKWSNKAIGLMGAIKMTMGIVPQLDEAAEERKGQTALALKENNAGDARYGFMTSVIVLMDTDRVALEAAAEQITKVIESLQFKIRSEGINATEAYLGSLPGHGCYNIRKPLVDSIYVSHALPVSSVWQGSPTAPCPYYPKQLPALMTVRTQGSRTFNFNLHVGDVGHFVMLGPTGNGKTTLLSLIMCQFLKYPQARLIVFDKDYSNRVCLTALGGDYFDVYGGAEFAPLASLAAFEEGSNDYEAELLFLVQWLCEICELQQVAITPDRKTKIAESLRALAKAGQEHLKLDLLHVQDPEVRQAIASFNSGAIQKMLNGHLNNFKLNGILGLEMGALLKLPESVYVPVVRMLFHQLTRLFLDRYPTLLLIEEAWSVLRHAIFENMLEDWLLTLRKFNVVVGFISQNLNHITQSRISDTIKESCPTKIFLPNTGIHDKHIYEKYLNFDLNEQQIAIIGSAAPKQDYYVTSPLGNRLIQLDLDALTLSFIGVSSKDDMDNFYKIHRANDLRWILDWLAYKNLHDWKKYAEQTHFQGEYYA